MKRWFSFALVLAMCLTTIMGDFTTTFAEDGETVIEAVDLVVPEADERQMDIGEDAEGIDADGLELDDTLPVAEDMPSIGGEESPEEQGLSVDAEVELDRDNEPENADETDEVVSDAAETGFAPWYARALTSLALAIDEEVSRTIPADSILLVTEEVGAGLVHVACEGLSDMVDVTALEALTEDEVQDFMDGLTRLEDVSFYQDDLDYPLPPQPTEPEAEQTENAEEDQPSQGPDEASEAPADESAAEDGVEEGEKTEVDPENTEAVDDETAEKDDAAAESADGEKSEDADGEDEKKSDETAEGEKTEDTEKSEKSDAVEAVADGDAAQETAESESTVMAEASSAEKIEAEAGGVPAAVAVNMTSLTLGVKEVYTGLTASLVDANGAAAAGPAITWASSNTRVVKVDANGTLTAVRSGKATVVVTAEGLPQTLVSVIVKKAPTKVSLTPKKANMSIGMGYQLNAKLSKGSASGRLTFTSSNPGVAVVDENGLVTGVGLGKATITVRTFNKKRATFKVSVFSEPASIATDKSSYSILHGKSGKIVISLLDAAGIKTYSSLNIVSSDPNIVAVDGNGKIVGVNMGTATITITAHNGLSTSCTVDVAAQAVGMVLNADTITIGVKEKYTRMDYTLIPPEGQTTCAATVTWKSKNKKIAKVNSKTGVITGVKAGTTTIIATTNNKISKKVKVVVQKAPKSVSLSPKELALTVGMTGQLSASYNAKKVNTNVAYASSDPGVAVVDANGLVTAVGRGSATITVATYNGKTDTCVVNVYNDPAQVMISDTLSVAVGATAQLSCSVVDAEGQPSTASFTFSVVPETGNVEVDANGRVKGVTMGTARVRVTTQNGVSTHYDGSGKAVITECVVTITEAPPVRYRVFAAYDFYNVSAKGSLTFPRNNATSFLEVMSGASVDGVKYESVGLLENPSKDALLSGIVNAFSGSRDTDINVLYLVSHGTNKVDIPKSASYTHYGLQLPGYSNYKSSSAYYVTSEEIFNAISTINGRVILVLDSCYSGQFITNMKNELNAAGGRISVMTAATNTTACYYNIANTTTACDFFTMYLLLGAGYNMRTHTYSGSHPADANGDGRLTFNEMFSYAKSSVKTNVPKYKNKSWFHGNYKQSPNVYAGSNGDLVLFQYA